MRGVDLTNRAVLPQSDDAAVGGASRRVFVRAPLGGVCTCRRL